MKREVQMKTNNKYDNLSEDDKIMVISGLVQEIKPSLLSDSNIVLHTNLLNAITPVKVNQEAYIYGIVYGKKIHIGESNQSLDGQTQASRMYKHFNEATTLLRSISNTAPIHGGIGKAKIKNNEINKKNLTIAKAVVKVGIKNCDDISDEVKEEIKSHVDKESCDSKYYILYYGMENCKMGTIHKTKITNASFRHNLLSKKIERYYIATLKRNDLCLNKYGADKLTNEPLTGEDVIECKNILRGYFGENLLSYDEILTKIDETEERINYK